jgi:hypothetical protein
VVTNVSEEYVTSTLKMEVTHSSGTLITTYKTTWHHNPGDQDRHDRKFARKTEKIMTMLLF